MITGYSLSQDKGRAVYISKIIGELYGAAFDYHRAARKRQDMSETAVDLERYAYELSHLLRNLARGYDVEKDISNILMELWNIYGISY